MIFMSQRKLDDFAGELEVNNSSGGCETLTKPEVRLSSPPKAETPSEGVAAIPSTSTNRRSKRRPLTFEQANDYAFIAVCKFPLGTQFTCYKLFNGLPVAFDRRRLNVIMHNLVRAGLISGISWVSEDMENGNSSVSRLWEKVKDV